MRQKYKYDESFTVLQLIGFLMLFVGVLMYNELIVVRAWGFDKNTLEALASRDRLRHSKIEE